MLTSGMLCLDSSASAEIGNCPSRNGAPSVAPNRKSGHDTSSLNRQNGGNELGGARPARTLLMTAWLNPERPRPTWSGRYTGCPLLTKYSSQPIRPSGVVSHALPVWVIPWIITTGTFRPACGTMYRTYIWLTV